MYGVTKVFNEHLGDYYNRKFGVDFRCLRYPGVISSKKFGFNGSACWTTGKIFTFNIHLEIFFEALEKGKYKCWLNPDTKLPFVYIDDCIAATVSLLMRN